MKPSPNQIKSCALAVALLIGMAASALAEPPTLTKPDAAKIIQAMGYSNVVIAFIVTNPQGVEVRALGSKNGTLQNVDQRLQYDNDLGWFHSEPLMQYSEFIGYRIWNTNGYSEIKPPGK